MGHSEKGEKGELTIIGLSEVCFIDIDLHLWAFYTSGWKWSTEAMVVLEHDTIYPSLPAVSAPQCGYCGAGKTPPDVPALQGLMAGTPMRISKLSLESLRQTGLHFQRQVTKFALRFVSHAQSGRWWICCPWKQKAKMSSAAVLDSLWYCIGLRPLWTQTKHCGPVIREFVIAFHTFCFLFHSLCLSFL